MRIQAIELHCCGVILFLCQVFWSQCEVTLVTRNVTDSFRIGKDSCIKNNTVCTTARATCQPSGLCLCNNGYPNFRNPTIIPANSSWTYSNSFGCISQENIQHGVKKATCDFRPYQVIPSEYNEKASSFSHAEVHNCDFYRAEAKYPNNNKQINLTWLNESYLELKSVATNSSVFQFQWKKPVPQLQGLIVTITLYCAVRNTTGRRFECLQAKVAGTWLLSLALLDLSTAMPTNYPTLKSFLTHSRSSIHVGSSSPSEMANPDRESNWTKSIAISMSVISIVLLVVIILLAFAVFSLFKRLQKLKVRQATSEVMLQENPNYLNTTNADPPEQYEDLKNDGLDISDEHFYQGLVGAPGYLHSIESTGDNKEQNYESLKRNRHDSDVEHGYQGLTASRK